MIKTITHMDSLSKDSSDPKLKRLLVQKKKYRRAQLEPFFFDFKNTYKNCRNDFVVVLDQVEEWMS